MKTTRLLLLVVSVVLTANLFANPTNFWIATSPGTWFDSTNWSQGLPGPLDDVVISTGGNDWVVLNTSASISSLTLGGSGNGSVYLSDYYGGGPTLAIAGSLNIYNHVNLTLLTANLTVGADSQNAGVIDTLSSATINGNFNNSGSVFVDGNGSFTVNGTLTNSGSLASLEVGIGYLPGGTLNATSLNNTGDVVVGSGGVLAITNGPTLSDIPYFAQYTITGTFTIAGVDALSTLSTLEGGLYYSAKTTTITPGAGSLTNSGFFEVNDGSNVTVNGDLNNNLFLTTGSSGTGNTLTVNGIFTNNYEFDIQGAGDVVNAGQMVNNGSIYVAATGVTLNLSNLTLNTSAILDVSSGASLAITGDVTNYGYVSTGDHGPGGNTLSVAGNFDNEYRFELSGTNDIATIGTLTNNATVNLFGAGSVLNAGSVANTNNGSFNLYGTGSAANVGTLVNSGAVYVGPGTTLNLTNQPGGIPDVPAGSGFLIAGNFNSVVDQGSGFFNLSSIEGYVYIQNRQTTDIFPGSNLLSISSTGELDIGNNSTFNIHGDVYNAGSLSTGRFDLHPTANTLTITGNLLNDAGGLFSVNGVGDVANVGVLSNNGRVYVGPGATLNLFNQDGGISDIPYGAGFQVLGTINSVDNGGNGFLNLGSIEGYLHMQNGQTTNITPGGFAYLLTISNSGELDVSNNSTVNIDANIYGDVYNSGVLSTGKYDASPTANTLTIAGNLYNEPGAFLNVNGVGDVANVATLSNSGNVYVGRGATLNLTAQPGGNTYVLAGSSYVIQGDFVDVTNGTSAFAQLTNIYGSVIIDNGQTIQDNPIGLTLTIFSGGSLNVMNGSTLLVHSNVLPYAGANVYLDPASLIIDGTFFNYGANVTVDGDSVFRVGSFSNGGPLMLTHDASITVANGFYQLASGTLGESIDATGYSIVTVNGGPVVLDGTLDVLLDPNFDPTVGSFYKFLLFGPGALSGTFASIQNSIFNNGTEKWVVVYNDAGGYVELLAQSNSQATPEPASFLLLGTGLLGLSFGLRKRMSR